MKIKGITKGKKLVEDLHNEKFISFDELTWANKGNCCPEKKLSDTPRAMFSIPHLTRVKEKEDQEQEWEQWKYVCIMDLLSVILTGDAENPSNFLKYKALIDLIIQKYGPDDVFFAYKSYFCHWGEGGATYEWPQIRISKQMQIYLRQLKIRNNVLKEQNTPHTYTQQVTMPVHCAKHNNMQSMYNALYMQKTQQK